MPFDLEDSPRLSSATPKAPLLLFWIAGILLGLGYLAMPGYLFWTLSVLFLSSILIVRDFRYGYYLLILILPVELTHLAVSPRDIATYDIHFFPYLLPLCITLAGWLVAKAWKNDLQGKTAPVSGLLFFMVTYMLISLLWAPLSELGVLLAVSLTLNFLVFFLTRAVIIDEATLRRASVVWVWMGFITATGVILSQWYSYKATWQLTGATQIVVHFGEFLNRPAGFGSSDNMAGLLVSSMFITMGILMTSSGFTRRFFLFLLIIYQAIAMIETTSRGALIGFVAGLILLFTIHPSTKSRVLRHSFLAVLLLGLTILIAKPAYIDRLLVGFGYTGTLYFSEVVPGATSQESVNLSSRVNYWKKAFKEMTKRPYKLILGLGLGGVIAYSGLPHTHSVPISFFFDLGLAGAVIFIVLALILLTNFSHYIRHARRTRSYYIFIVAVAAFVAEVGVHGLIDYDFYSYTACMFWFPLGYACAALNVMMSENPEL